MPDGRPPGIAVAQICKSHWASGTAEADRLYYHLWPQTISLSHLFHAEGAGGWDFDTMHQELVC